MTFLPHGRVVVDEVARSLGKRTLARKLSDEGLNFTEVLQQLRRDLAVRYLDDPNIYPRLRGCSAVRRVRRARRRHFLLPMTISPYKSKLVCSRSVDTGRRSRRRSASRRTLSWLKSA